MKNSKRLTLFVLCFILGCAQHLPDFTSELSTRLPINDRSEAIGDYSLGCLRGAVTFNGSEKGIVLSQKKRGRYWGHPNLINLVTNAGFEFNKSNQKLIIGDLSQSRGGPTITGHHSHQTGLDVDVWFKILNNTDSINFQNLETEEMKPISSLSEDQIKLIKYFADDPEVERIFINPHFKKKLCLSQEKIKLTPAEHHKLRAWWGHDDHIHVRLKCPKDSLKCLTQKVIPEGDGCGDDLNWWFGEEAAAQDVDSSYEELKSIYLDKIRKLPLDCHFYLI